MSADNKLPKWLTEARSRTEPAPLAIVPLPDLEPLALPLVRAEPLAEKEGEKEAREDSDPPPRAARFIHAVQPGRLVATSVLLGRSGVQSIESDGWGLLIIAGTAAVRVRCLVPWENVTWIELEAACPRWPWSQTSVGSLRPTSARPHNADANTGETLDGGGAGDGWVHHGQLYGRTGAGIPIPLREGCR